MRVALPRLLTLLALGLALAAPAVPAFAQEQVVNSINGIGLVDYSRKPDFKIGDWVRYRMSGSSLMGMRDDYTVTVLIAGEEDFWGDPGVWIETWTEFPGRPPEAVATLMSYSIFGDSLAVPRMQMYMRKSINSIDDQGRPIQQVIKRASQSLKSRNVAPRPPQWDVDTLQADTVITPRGSYTVVPVDIRQGTGVEQTVGDSTFYNEQRENRRIYYTPQVPITHVAREDVESIVSRRAYMIGRSRDAAPLRLREKANGTARLMEYGHGLEPRLVPARYHRTIAEQARLAESSTGSTRATGTRTGSRTGTRRR